MSVLKKFIEIRDRELELREKDKADDGRVVAGIEKKACLDSCGGDNLNGRSTSDLRELEGPTGSGTKSPQKKSRRILNRAESRQLENQIFAFLLQQKYVTRTLLLKKFTPSYVGNKACDTSLDKRLRKLRTGKFIRTLKVSGRTLYFLGSRGYQTIKNDRLRQIPLSRSVDQQTLEHDLICADVRIYLENFGGYEWQAETELRLHPGQPLHYPDAAFRYSERIVFLEVETSGKSGARYVDIASLYSLPKGPDRVLYFYKDTAIARILAQTMGDNPRIGLFPYSDPLTKPDNLTGLHQHRTISLAEFLKP